MFKYARAYQATDSRHHHHHRRVDRHTHIHTYTFYISMAMPIPQHTVLWPSIKYFQQHRDIERCRYTYNHSQHIYDLHPVNFIRFTATRFQIGYLFVLTKAIFISTSKTEAADFRHCRLCSQPIELVLSFRWNWKYGPSDGSVFTHTYTQILSICMTNTMSERVELSEKGREGKYYHYSRFFFPLLFQRDYKIAKSVNFITLIMCIISSTKTSNIVKID